MHFKLFEALLSSLVLRMDWQQANTDGKWTAYGLDILYCVFDMSSLSPIHTHQQHFQTTTY